ncbi:MAG: outer membrane beta-barrel protein [bacterium]|nr:outer membrane beta-barrel protein [bacterium]
MKGIFVLCLALLFAQSAQAQWAKTHSGGLELSLGAAVGLNQIPEESELKATSLPQALWGDLGLADWLRFSAGYLQHSAKLEYTAYNKDWSHRFKVTEWYLAYLHLYPLSDRFDLRSQWGLTQVSAKMTTNQGAADASANAAGWLFGCGLHYQVGLIEDLDMGVDLLITSASAELGGTKISLGTNQLLFGAAYHF